MKEFKGRVVVAGECTGKALVTKTGFNVLATYQQSLLEGDGNCICHDINNKDWYGRSLKNEILCMPQAVGSTTTGFMIQSVAAAGIQPRAILFARRAESLVLAGILVADIWEDTKIITIDELGDEFLDTVKEGSTIEITAEGKVLVSQ